jgi:glycolate oxidase iron-sulfur subunit
VPFGHLMELTRERIREQQPGSPLGRALRRVLLRGVFPYPARLRLLGAMAGLYQRTGLQAALRRARWLPRRLAEADALMPRVSDKPFTAPAEGWFRTTSGPARHRVGLLSGCVMSVAFADVDQATVRVLARNGCDVYAAPAQTCCGALHAHDGDLEAARELARRNITAFEAQPLDAIVVNAAGCGAMLKDYGELLHDDPAFAERALAFAARVKDVSEFLAGIDLNADFGRLDCAVTYQDACHLAHGQRVREAPRQLLRAIPGVRLVEMRDGDRCCGSAGIYNLTQPELSRTFMADKAGAADATGADVVVSANPGCMIQLQAGLRQRGSRTAVKHIVELLDEAYHAREEKYANQLDAGVGGR